MPKRTPQELAEFLKNRQAGIDARKNAPKPGPVYWFPELGCWLTSTDSHTLTLCDPPT